MTQGMISYAQNGEDVVLARALSDIKSGFYVDIGASDPELFSITKHFYNNGWQGINVEPIPLYKELYAQQRPRDTNLCIGISDTASIMPFYIDARGYGLSTFDKSVAEQHIAKGLTFIQEEVPVLTLETLFATYAKDKPIDFLKVDVEGYEDKVLAGNDWTKYRPRIVVFEVHIINVSEHDTLEVTHRCEEILQKEGYIFCLYDGLNQFWVRKEDLERKEKLSVPANIIDGYLMARGSGFCSNWIAELDRTIGQLQGAISERDSAIRQRDEALAQIPSMIYQQVDVRCQHLEEILSRKLDSIRNTLNLSTRKKLSRTFIAPIRDSIRSIKKFFRGESLNTKTVPVSGTEYIPGAKKNPFFIYKTPLGPVVEKVGMGLKKGLRSNKRIYKTYRRIRYGKNDPRKYITSPSNNELNPAIQSHSVNFGSMENIESIHDGSLYIRKKLECILQTKQR